MANTLLPVLEKIGPYRITGKLGSGGMGTVYKGIQQSLQRTVALKVVNPASAADPIFRDRFLREARAMAQVQSPYVVACFDAGLADGQLFMALELVTGGDLLGLLERKGGRLQEQLALALIRDCLEGLEAIEAAKLIHRDIKPANIFLSDRGTAKLADLGLARSVKTEGDRTTMVGMIVGTPAYIAPEQARGEDDLDIRTDLYSLGASLFHLVTGTTLYPGSDPLGTLVRVLNDPVPDARERCPDVSEPMALFIRRLLDKERTRRPPSARAARQMAEELLRGRRSRDDRTPMPTAVLPETTPATMPKMPAPPAATPRTVERTPLSNVALPDDKPTTRATARIDPAQLLQLAKRIVIDQEGLRASLALAPGANFPRALLNQLLEVSGITYGLIEDNLVAAGRTADLPRRITLAKGDQATPDAPGRDVRDTLIPPVDRSVVIRLSDDAMQAHALYKSKKPPTVAEVREALAAAHVVTGFDEQAIGRFAGKAPSGGKLTVAKGIPPVATIDAGFALTVGPSGDLGLVPVEPDQVVGIWRESAMGTAGRDVLGREISVEDPREPEPDSLVGAGVDIGRTRDGDLCLRATRQGVVQRQNDGMVRVVGVLEVPGDLDPSTPIVTDDVVVVRGSVLPGASLASTSDIVILGDLSQAAVSAGGDLEVRGSIEGGDELRAAGTVTAADVTNRRILAGNIRITGTLRGCDLASTGDITVGAVVGGSLAAGGDIVCGSLGDSSGIPTVVWAGHHLCLDREAELIRLDEARRESKRQNLMRQGSVLMTEQDDLSKRTGRLANAHFVKGDPLREARERQEVIAKQQATLRQEMESERRELMRTRNRRTELESHTGGARITVTGVAYDGVTVRVGDREPQLLTDPQVRPKF